MKKAVSVLICVLFALTLLYPCGFFLALCFGYSLKLFSVPAFSAVIAAMSAGLAVRMPAGGEPPASRTVRVLSALLTPCSLLNAGLLVFDDPGVLVIACALVSAGCCCFLTIRCGRPFALKLTCLVLSGILIQPLCFFGFLSVLLDGFGQNTVVRTLPSPNGKYCAQIIDSDQGALGGNTFVEVRGHGFNALLFRVEKQQRVYTGSWGAYQNMVLDWKDNETLLIDSAEYPVE